MAGLFITGTGTDVGKSAVTATLLWYARQQGMDAVPMKPMQTGTEDHPQGLAPDFEYYKKVAGYEPDGAELPLQVPYCYEPACSPHLAARVAGDSPDLKHIVDCARTLEDKHDLVLAEGAGGLLVPVNETQTMRDLAIALAYPVLVVAHAGLGTINHTLLTLEALKVVGLKIRGVVLCAPEPWDMGYIEEDNPKAIEQFGEVPVFGTLPWLAGLPKGENLALRKAAQAMKAKMIL